MLKRVGTGIALSLAVAFPSLAQYPERDITFITPSSPGGQADLGARTWLPYLEQCLGGSATVAVVARPGAGGAIGHQELLASNKDGYTIGTMMAPNIVTVPISGSAEWTMEDFDVLGTIVGGRSTIAVSRDSEIDSLNELIEFAKEADRPLNIAIGGIGGDDHLAGLELMADAGVDVTFVPFSDDASARNAVMGQHVDAGMMSSTAAIGFKDEIKTIGIAAEERNENLPDVPTFTEQGFEIVAGSTHIIGAPSGLPDEVLAELRSCVEGIFENPEFLEAAASRTVPLSLMNAEELEEFLRNSWQTYSALWESNPWIE